MTVATGAGGTTIVGATLGAGFIETGGIAHVGQGAADAVRTLPFTGANHIVLLFVLGLLALIAGALMLGLVRRHSSTLAAPPPA